MNKVKILISPTCHILAWVLMPNHFHFLIEATEDSCKNVNEKHRPELQLLAKNLGTVLSSYTQAINKQENRRGNLFAHNTKAKILNDELDALSGSNRLAHLTGKPDYATTCFLYLHQNPAMAGLVSNLEDWEFSSFRDYAGLRNGTLVKKEIAKEYIELDFDNFASQSEFLADEEILKRLY